NVGGLPEDLSFELVEPLRALFKDEVRAVGSELGLPDDIVWRQPFPGPGLGIRIIGEVTKERLDILRAADAIARTELTAAGLDRTIWQCPVVLLADVRSVGVQGDGRTYGHPIVLRPVTSDDAMTADWAKVPYDVLSRISSRITNEVSATDRVTLDITSKPSGTIEWESPPERTCRDALQSGWIPARHPPAPQRVARSWVSCPAAPRPPCLPYRSAGSVLAAARAEGLGSRTSPSGRDPSAPRRTEHEERGAMAQAQTGT